VTNDMFFKIYIFDIKKNDFHEVCFQIIFSDKLSMLGSKLIAYPVVSWQVIPIESATFIFHEKVDHFEEHFRKFRDQKTLLKH
jgi:hypothetical protein